MFRSKISPLRSTSHTRLRNILGHVLQRARKMDVSKRFCHPVLRCFVWFGVWWSWGTHRWLYTGTHICNSTSQIGPHSAASATQSRSPLCHLRPTHTAFQWENGCQGRRELCILAGRRPAHIRGPRADCRRPEICHFLGDKHSRDPPGTVKNTRLTSPTRAVWVVVFGDGFGCHREAKAVVSTHSAHLCQAHCYCYSSVVHIFSNTTITHHSSLPIQS